MPNKTGKTIFADTGDETTRTRLPGYPQQKHNSITKADIIDVDSLYNSMVKCQKNVSWKTSVTAFRLNWLERIITLNDELVSGKYKGSKPKPVIVTYPKRRECLCIPFRDRVYQRSLNDNALYPLITKSFIYCNAACQTGKGTEFARNKIKEFMRRYFREHGAEGYALHIDIRHYYPSMRHELAKDTFARYVPSDILKMAETVLDSQYSGDVGYNPGSQMVQIAGIAVPNDIDHYIIEQQSVEFYLRYMDDFIIIHHDKEYLKILQQKIEAKLSELGFSIHNEKTNIHTLKRGFLILGFTFRLTSNGKALMLIDGENVKHEKRKLRKLVKRAKAGLMTRKEVNKCYGSWKAHALAGDTFQLIMRMDKFYKELWR